MRLSRYVVPLRCHGATPMAYGATLTARCHAAVTVLRLRHSAARMARCHSGGTAGGGCHGDVTGGVGPPARGR